MAEGSAARNCGGMAVQGAGTYIHAVRIKRKVVLGLADGFAKERLGRMNGLT